MRGFLDETYDRQLKILSYIDNKKKVVTIKQISDDTNLSEKTVLQIIRRFEQELTFTDHQFQIIHSNKSIRGIYAENLDLMEIASGYVKKSVLYKMIRNIFLYEKVDVKKFCEVEYISPPTFSRYRQQLIAILEQFGLKLTRENQIHGDEMKIRNFFYQFFSHSSSEWEFSLQEYREIETYIYKQINTWQANNKIKQRKICLLVYISNVRSSQKHYCENDIMTQLTKRLNMDYQSDYAYLNGLFGYFLSKKNRTVEQVWSELAFIQLFLYIEDLSDETIDYDNYEAYFSEQNFPFIEQSNLLTKKIIATFFSEMDPTDKKLFLQIRQEIDKMHLVLSGFYIDSRIFYYVYDHANFYYRDKVESEIFEHVKRIVAELIEEPRYQPLWNQLKRNTNEEAFINYLYLIIYALVSKLQQYTYKTVNVMVQNSKLFIEGIISNKLMLIFGDRIQLVDGFRNNPDILITDVHLPDTPKQTKELFVSSFSDLIDFNSAVDGIKKEIINQYNQRVVRNNSINVHLEVASLNSCTHEK